MIDFIGLSDETVAAVRAESLRAHLKHRDSSMINPDMPTIQKLAALIEECGEVATELTYDGSGRPGALDHELIQVANVALTWWESRQRAGAIRERRAALEAAAALNAAHRENVWHGNPS